MSKLFSSLLAVVVLLAMPLAIRAQVPPTPAQIQALQNAVTQLQVDDAAYQTQEATVATDTTAVAAAQQTLAGDTGTANATAAKVQADVQAVIAAAQALQGMQAKCSCKTGINTTDDQADMAEAVARGFGSRIAIGPYREATQAIRAWRAALTGPNDPDMLTKLQTELGRTPRFTACQKATMAVIGLEMVNSFSPGTIPPQVLALAIQLQAQACGTPVPPVPTLAPIGKIPKVPTKAIKPVIHGKGLKQLPLNVRKALHVKDALVNKAFHSKHGNVLLPPIYDIRGKLVTPMKDQGQCGSCHDFSGICCLESACILVGLLAPDQASWLSEQFILDTNPNGDGGCDGGDASTIFQWCAQQGGAVPLTSVYGAYQGQSYGASQLSTTAVGYADFDWGYADTVTGIASVQAVKEALVTYGAISVCIGCPDRFMSYSGGVIDYDLSSGIDHQIAIVGYADDPKVSGGGYWIVRNSWGTGWGEQGYFRAAYSSSPTTEAMYCKAKAGTTFVIQPGSGPQPGPAPTPTRRAAKLLLDKIEVYQHSTPEQQKVLLKQLDSEEKATKAAKASLHLAP